MSEAEETTNAVLSEQIKGLVKLTDERFGNLRDGIKEIKDQLVGFATKSELDEIKKDFNKTIDDIKKGFAQHNVDDKESFTGLLKKMDTVSRNQWIAWGGIAVIMFILQVILPYFFKI